MSRELARGSVIKLPFGSLYLSASGTFDHAGEPFDPSTKETGRKLTLHFRVNKAEETRIAQVPPELAAGQYSLIVRTSPNEKDIKEAMLSDPVSVA